MILPKPRPVPVAYEAPFRWLVPSGSRPGEKHLVELDAYGVNGRCSCPDFTCRHEPGLRADPRTGGVDRTRCKHIRLVRSHFLDQIIRQMRNGLAALGLLLCASLSAAPSDAFLDALAWTETRNQPDTVADGGNALGAYCFHRSAWMDADRERAKRGLPRADYETGARCPATSRAYASTLLTHYEERLRRKGFVPTAERLWLCWTMGFAGAERVGFKVSRSPKVKQRGFARLAQHLGGRAAVDNT